MQVIDEITGRKVNIENAVKVLVRQTENLIQYGWVNRKNLRTYCIELTIYHDEDGISYKEKLYALIKNLDKENIFFGNSGKWVSKLNMPEKDYLRERFQYKGRLADGHFPYHFEKKYEAIENFKVFEGKQKILEEEIHYPLSDYLKYTFGLEFETSMGLIPEETCFINGLIPLRDGSISGLEYSTVVMEGNKGLNLLKQQTETLKNKTHFNKECSLHIHFGGFPLNSRKIWSLYQLCYCLQLSDLPQHVPPLTFNTARYKSSGKDYCKMLGRFTDFNQMYQGLVGRPYFGSLEQAHPNDVDRNRKWQIGTRYYWVNFINMLCYKVNKTVEFRFLRPTYNYRKITAWMYIMNAILMYAEKDGNEGLINSCYLRNNSIRLDEVLYGVYPKDVSQNLSIELFKLRLLAQNQALNGDEIGQDLSFEEELFDDSKVL